MKTPLKLICENDFANTNIKLLVEADNEGKPKCLKFTGPYIIAEQENANGRIYSSEIMEQAVQKYYTEYIDQSRACGEMNHPESVEVDFNNACHMIESLERDGDVWVGTSKVLVGTPKGDLLKGLLENGVKVGVSTRGVGNVNENSIVDEFQLIAVDVVSNPSGPGAFVNGILESRNYMVNQYGEIMEMQYQKLERDLSKLPLKEEDKKIKIMAAFEKFIKGI